MTKLTGLLGRLNGDLGKLFGIGHIMHAGIGDKYCPPLGNRNRKAHRDFAFFGVNHTGNIGKAAIEVPGQPGDQAICMPLCHHDRSKNVAFLVHHPLAIAPQIPFALQAFIHELGIFRIAI